MTIIIATRRRSSVVIAADRQWHGFDTGGNPTTGITSKIAIHPRYPLAVATGGFYRLPVNAELRVVTELVQERINLIDRIAGVDARSVANVLGAELSPTVATALQLPGLPDEPEKNMVGLTIGTIHRGTAQLLRVRITGNGIGIEEGQGFIDAPPSLQATFEQEWLTDHAVFAPKVEGPERIGRHFKAVIEEALAEDARLHGGRNFEIGGGADVVIVQGVRARRVP